MKWKNDLIKDIRYLDYRDDIDDPREIGYKYSKDIDLEFSICNQTILRFIINKFKPKLFLEIGVHRNGLNSSTSIIHEMMNDNCIYLGIDLEDKSYLNKSNIHTLKCNSSEYNTVLSYMSKINMKEIDLLFIDGWHSINQILKDWEYTNLLSKNGIIVFHDTTAHPGPKAFIDNLDREKYIVEIHCLEDYGISYCYAKK